MLTSALGAFQGLPNMSRDSAAKAYVLNLGEALHYELAPAGVDVTVLLPGSVDTQVIHALGPRGAALPIRPQPTEAAVRKSITAFLKHRPLHIPGRPMRIMTRLLPRSLAVRMNGLMPGQAARTLAQRHVAPAEQPAGRRISSVRTGLPSGRTSRASAQHHRIAALQMGEPAFGPGVVAQLVVGEQPSEDDV